MSGRKKFINKKFLVSFVAVCAISITCFVGYKVIDYKAYVWLPYFFQHSSSNDFSSIKDGHVMLLFVDHHEPGHGIKGVERSRRWNKKYREVIEGIYDDYGNSVQYSWFYPYDHKNEGILPELNKMVFDGLGEVEFHWHHGNDTNETFSAKLGQAVSWFNNYGIMLPAGEKSKPAFGFIHGNWALDNSESGRPDWCGVNRELDILKEYGCYADFTFPTLGFVAQPEQVNSIYYGKDDDGPKSYNTGSPVKVGGQPLGLMIFQGPMGLDFHDFCFDCAAVELGGEFRSHRAALWLSHAPHIQGRDNWFFVKVNTHGRQSSDVILSDNFREMYLEMKEICKNNGLSLHFVTAREAYNIVKAAEAGMDGDPELYKDYVIQPPVNKFVLIEKPVKEIVVTDTLTELKPLKPKNVSNYEFDKGPILSVSGIFTDYRCQFEGNGNWHLMVRSTGEVEIVTKNEFKIDEKVALYKNREDGAHVYSLKMSTPVDVYLK